MNKIIFAIALLMVSKSFAGFDIPIQPYVSGSLRAPVGSQQSYELNRMLIGMWCYPTKGMEMLFEYNGITAKPNFAFGRGYRSYGKWELSALVGRHKNPIWYTVPTIHDLRLPRLPITMEPFAPSAFATGAGAWVKYGNDIATLRFAHFDTTHVSVCVTALGLSWYWQDNVGTGMAAHLDEFFSHTPMTLGYRGYGAAPYLAVVVLNEEIVAEDSADGFAAFGVDVRSPYPVELHWLTETSGDEAWNSLGASYQYMKRSFIKAMYDGRFKTSRVDVSFYAAW